MEKFKAVEKEMKTKQYSKEGLSAATKMDPKDKEKMDSQEFLESMIDSLNQQVEALEAEVEVMQAGIKKKKSDTAKVDRVSELERHVERHKWHGNKLEILLRALGNDSVEPAQVTDIEESIKYYVEQNQEVDFLEDDTLYDDLNLEEEEDAYGMNNADDKGSSDDGQSQADDSVDGEPARSASLGASKSKSQSVSEGISQTRRPSVQLKSPLPILSTLQSSLPNNNIIGKPAESMKPAPLPTIPTGQPLKYASAAAAAAASDKSGVGIAPLPPPPGVARTSETSSPAASAAQLASVEPSPAQPAPAQPAKVSEAARQISPPPAPTITPSQVEARATESVEPVTSQPPTKAATTPTPPLVQAQPVKDLAKVTQTPDSGVSGVARTNGDTAPEEDLESAEDAEEEEEESIYHLPSSLNDLLDSFEETKTRASSSSPAFDVPMLNASRLTAPTPLDAEKPNHYQPQTRYPYTPAHYPQEPLGIFDDPRLYSRIDTDSLFYAFYYRQGTYQQYLAAKALKSQSWRFHKQYQTWFQRHEEPKNITEEFEQGTYRFFDYESTW